MSSFTGGGLTVTMVLKGGLEHRQMLVSLEAPEALLRFQHARGGPAQSHLRVPPALHIPAYLANDAVHALDDVGAGQRAAQIRREAKPVDGQDLVHTLENGRPVIIAAKHLTGLDQGVI